MGTTNSRTAIRCYYAHSDSSQKNTGEIPDYLRDSRMPKSSKFPYRILRGKKMGKREYLNDVETKNFTTRLNDYCETIVEIPRMRVGEKQTIRMLINEKALLFVKCIKKKRRIGHPETEFHS